MSRAARDHGGDLDAAMARYGGAREDWLDLSTGINPVAYPVGEMPKEAWTRLPDKSAMEQLLIAAREFWRVPDKAEIIAAPGASALISRLPYLGPGRGEVQIPGPTYNEHAAAFEAHGQWVVREQESRDTKVLVHPNNPDGRVWPKAFLGGRRLTIVDESFCDVCPDESHVHRAEEPGVLILKSFGKFWGLAGLRLGFAIGRPDTLAPLPQDHAVAPPPTLSELLGPWSVAGPALDIGARALADTAWADSARARLAKDAARLDGLFRSAGAALVGGTTLFRLYAVEDALAARDHLAQHRIWSRIFPYSRHWLRLGLPHPERWEQLETALGTAGGAMAQPSGDPSS